MTPVVPSSISNVLPIPGTPFITRKNECLKRCNLVRNSTKQIWSSQKYILPLSTSARLFPQFRTGFALRHKLSATGTDLAVEEADSTISDEDLVSTSEASSVKSEPIAGPTQSKRSKPTRKSEMPPVNPEELVPGATFTGKVRSIQPFGAFVDFGAFTDGLVHVSRLSDSFVKDVGNVVTVGQEVTVRLVEANTETGRISLTMRVSDDISKLQQRKDSPPSADKSRQPRKGPPRSNQKRDEVKKTSKFVKGQDLEGSVKNLTRSGAFISLPEGEEGFLPQSEEVDEGFANMMGGSSLQVGQEVSVRVLRISRGQVTLTMKKEEAAGELDSKLNQGVIHMATSPFLLAFRKNKDIASFLDEREKEEEPSETKLEIGGDETSSKGVDLEASAEEELELLEESPSTSGQDNEKGAQIADDNESLEISVSDTLQSVASEEVAGSQADDVIAKDEVQVPPPDVVNDISSPTIREDEETVAIPDNNGTLTSSDGQIDAPTSQQSTIEENEVTEEVENVIDTPAADNEIPSATLVEDAKVESAPEEENVESSVPPTNGSTTKENEVSEKVENVIDTPAADNEIPSAAPVEDAKVESAPEEENVESSVPPTNGSTTKENEVSKEVENVIETPAADSEIPSAAPVEEAKVESASEEKSIITASNEESSVPPTNGSTPKATISPALVKQLREGTGAGMMDCKKALSETGGDLVKAQEFLRKKGLASADKKASRATAEGRIGSYIHDSRIGVLIEVNCETDFVSRGEIFKGLVDDLAMQVAACPQVQYLVTGDVDKEIVEKEREIEMQKEDLLLKPEQIRSKIVEGRINKRLEELALLEQPYIKNDKVVVKDWVKQTISTIGENIKVKRFVRFNLGEGLERKSQDFAAEVAAQTAAKSVPSPGKEQPAVVEEKPVVDNTPKVTVSAALVKQLREETGAGMMDCKKALSETGGDLEKAQEYLRKKGLASADKKSSRLAAEGRIGSYIHDSRIGILIEVNCETDFVGRSEKFKELVDDLAMQVAACPQVQHVSIEDIPESIVQKEKGLEMQREDLQLKPENIREKIVEGRVSKRLGELALLEQPFIKDDSVLVKDLVKQTVAALGENIKVRRFVRFTLGETNESSETEKEA